MADTKISALTDGGVVANTDVFPVVRSGANRKVTGVASYVGSHASAAALEAAYPAASNAGATALVGGIPYFSSGAAWSAVQFSALPGPVTPTRILAIGTSITNKWGDSGAAGSSRSLGASSYLYWFLAALRGNIKAGGVINKGVSSDTTTLMAARYAADVAANYTLFDVLVFEPGPNDYAASLSAATIQANITTIVSAATSNGKFVLLLTPTPSESWTSAQTAVFQEVRNWMFNNYNGQTSNVRLVDVNALMSDPVSGRPLSELYVPTSFEATRVHPSMSGAQVMGRAMASAFPVAKQTESQQALGPRDHYEYMINARLQGNNASGSRNFYAGAGITVTGGPDASAIKIVNGSFSSVTIAPVASTGGDGEYPAGGTRITFNTAGADRSLVYLRLNGDDNAIGGTQFGRWDQAAVATSTAYGVGQTAKITALPDGILVCFIPGTTGASLPANPANYGDVYTSGGASFIWKKLPAVGDVVQPEIEYEIESVTGGIAIKAAFQICRSLSTEQFCYGVNGAYDQSATVAEGTAGVFMPRKGVLPGLPLTLVSPGAGINVRYVLCDVIFMLPNGGSATVVLKRVSLRRLA